jgi:hypothetical protein
MKNRENYSSQLKNQLQLLRAKAKDELAAPMASNYEVMNESRIIKIMESDQRIFMANKKRCDKIAEFRFENAKDIVNFLIMDISNFRNTIENDLNNWKDNFHDLGKWDIDPRMVGEAKMMDEMLEEFHHFVLDCPRITSCPDIIQVGYNYTIIGVNFGDTAGKMEIRISDDAHMITPSIDSWSNNAILFNVPDNTGGISFEAAARIIITHADGPPKTSSKSITINPISDLYTCIDSYSDEGHNNPFAGYARKVTLKSFQLPSCYRRWDNQNLTERGLLLKTASCTYGSLESEPSFSHTAMNVSGNRLQTVVSVKDDWHYCYQITAEFYILVPQGFDTGSWSIF